MLYFWVRYSRNPTKKKMRLFFGSEDDYNFFYTDQGYSSWFSENPPCHAPPCAYWWTLHEQTHVTTEYEKKVAAKDAAMLAATTAGWVVVEETYDTQAFLNT